MNMFADNKATTVKEYLDAVPDERKEIINYIDKLIRKTVPNLKRHFAFNMIGYGSFEYVDYKKKTNQWPIVALANQKNYVSIYVCAVEGQEYLAEKYKDDLGKVSVGKSCIRFKKLDNLNEKTLVKVLKLSETNAGLVGAKKVE